MKYIPAEKLLSGIKKILDENKYDTTYDCAFRDGNNCAVQRIKNLAVSLQREPKSSSNLVDIDTVREDFIAEVYRVLDADPTNDRANAIIDAFDSLPTVSQVQPEVDLEKEIDKEWENCGPIDKGMGYESALLISEQFHQIARHFYALGRARKEE